MEGEESTLFFFFFSFLWGEVHHEASKDQQNRKNTKLQHLLKGSSFTCLQLFTFLWCFDMNFVLDMATFYLPRTRISPLLE